MISTLLILLSGALIGSLIVWQISRLKLKHEYDRARAETQAERATLAERLADHGPARIETE